MPTVLHRCDAYLVVDKPAGLLTVPSKGPEKQDCLINRLLPTYPNARIVHRLDQPTSGLVVVPLGYEPLRSIGRQFEQRQVAKTYQAVVTGLMTDRSEEHTSELQSRGHLVCRLLLEKKNNKHRIKIT